LHALLLRHCGGPPVFFYVSLNNPVRSTPLQRTVAHQLNLMLRKPLVMRAASGAPAVLIACIGFIDCELRYVAVTILCLTYFTNSCCRAGMMVNHVDISPKSARLSDFLARVSRLCYYVRLSVCPSVCIGSALAHYSYLGFKFRSKFTVHCGRSACREEAGVISRYDSHC